MPTLRLSFLPLLLAASLGVSSCGGGDEQSKVAPTDPVVKVVEEQAAQYDTEVKASQLEVEAIEAKVKRGEMTRRKGDAKVAKVTKALEEETSDLAAAAESAAGATGSDVTKLDLDGGDAAPRKP